jgi:hypothetical protein
LDTDYLNGMSNKFRKWTLNKENIEVYLVDWNKIHRFVRQTGVGSKSLVSYSRKKKKFFEIKILCEVRNGKLVKYINLLT